MPGIEKYPVARNRFVERWSVSAAMKSTGFQFIFVRVL